MRILVIEDDGKMAELLRRGLTERGHSVEIAADGLDGLAKAAAPSFDAIVLDVMLPGIDGLGFVRRLRSGGARIPVLMLTARDSAKDVVRGLDLGADDYMTKPFSFEVLLARLRVIGRRLDTETELRFADLRLNTDTHEVRRSGRELALTRTEFVLLEHLMRRAGRVVSREVLTEAVWGFDRDVESNALDVFIFQLRGKTEFGGARRLIQTVRGFGYAMRENDE